MAIQDLIPSIQKNHLLQKDQSLISKKIKLKFKFKQLFYFYSDKFNYCYY